MNVPNARCTMFFAQGLFGWSETHFYVPIVTTLPEIFPEAARLAAKRTKILGAGVTLTYVRLSFDNIWRDSEFLPSAQMPVPTSSNPVGYDGRNTSDLADQPYSVTTALLSMGSLNRKIAYLGGMPSKNQSSNAPTDWTAGSKADWAAYFNYLCNLDATGNSLGTANWGVSTRTRGVVGNTTSFNGLPTYANGIISYTLAGQPANPIVPGSYVRILGIKQTPGANVPRLNGNSYIATVTGLVVTVVLKPGSPPPQVISTVGATMEVIGNSVKPYTNYRWEALTHRKRGRPFTAPHGRVRKAK